MPDSSLTMRDAFISELVQFAKDNKDILFISNDFGAPSLDRFRKELSEQYINAGISEQNMLSAATGLAMSGKRVFIYSIASFITTRSYEQMKLDICIHKVPVTFIAVGACYAYPQDGPTHHATEDIAIMRALSGMQVYSPSDAFSAQKLVTVSLGSEGPTYLRLDKGLWPHLERTDYSDANGLSVLKEGSDVGIIATGIMCHRAMEVAEVLGKKGQSCRVIDLWKLKPLQTSALTSAISGLSMLVSLEEHCLNGGLGSLIAEFILDNDIPIRLKRIGIPDEKLYTYGIRQTLHSEIGLDVESLVQTISSFMETV